MLANVRLEDTVSLSFIAVTTVVLACAQGAVAATYKAMSQSPRAPNLGPVVMSDLARRRRKSRPKSSTDA